MPTFPPPGDGYTLVAQRTATRIEPGFLPGSAGFDGTDGADFGESAEDLHDTTTILFQAVFRGAIEGQMIAEGVAPTLPVTEIEYISSTGPEVPITPPILAAYLVPRPSSLAITDAPLQGSRYNWSDGSTSPAGVTGFDGITDKVTNDGGTPADATLSPRHREIAYLRFWAEGPPEGVLLAMATSETERVCRGWRNASTVWVLEFWERTAWVSVTTPLTVTGKGALLFDPHHAERLWLAIENGSGGISLRYTEDEGRSFSVATTVTSSGTAPAECASPRGVRFVFWVNGDTIKMKAYDPQQSVYIAERTVVSSDVADSPISCTYADEVVWLTYKNDSGAVISKKSTDGGLTFS